MDKQMYKVGCLLNFIPQFTVKLAHHCNPVKINIKMSSGDTGNYSRHFLYFLMVSLPQK